MALFKPFFSEMPQSKFHDAWRVLVNIYKALLSCKNLFNDIPNEFFSTNQVNTMLSSTSDI